MLKDDGQCSYFIMLTLVDFCYFHWGVEKFILASLLLHLELLLPLLETDRATKSLFWLVRSPIKQVVFGHTERSIN